MLAGEKRSAIAHSKDAHCGCPRAALYDGAYGAMYKEFLSIATEQVSFLD